ncbi:LexA family protein [Mariprofundus erugo]|uniref:LexA family protein n=1 Tax=Mariprofundus erugo TaxID=2528639 RepID=UPI001EE860D3|nr:translesion error-prone DNA polymerase V autoproteolytic subunit [Mariprofundus erugo]
MYAMLRGMKANRDDKHLDALKDYFANHKALPSYAGIAELLGMSSRASVQKLVSRLKENGYLDTKVPRRLVPTAKFLERRLVGSSPAGFPSPAEEAMGDAISIDDYLVEHPSKTVLVEVKGDSMVGAGINTGDILIVKRESRPRVDRIIVAIVDGEFTIKHLRKDNEGYYLEPDNPAYPIIRPQTDLKMYGVVVGQFRKYDE